jgi:hypothetical protein
LYWLTSSTAELSVTNNAASTSRLKVAGYLIPPPCPGATAEVSVGAKGGSFLGLETSTGPARFVLPVTVAAGAAVVVRFHVSSGVCRIATDPRTFFAGLSRLVVSTV